MSKRKAFEPGTYVPGSRPVLDKIGKHVVVKGVPLWHTAKPQGQIIHFKNAAAKLRALKAAADRGMTINHPNEAIPLASPRDLVKVPLYRGFDARFANVTRAMMRRRGKVPATQAA